MNLNYFEKDIVFNTAFNCLPIAFLMFYFSADYDELFDYSSSYQNAFYLCLGVVLTAGNFLLQKHYF